jgi:hypothetical protein
VCIKFPEGNFVLDKRYVNKRFKTITNILADCQTSEIDLSNTPVSYEIFNHLLDNFSIMKKETSIALEMLNASNFLEDTRLHFYCLDIATLIIRKKLKVSILNDLAYDIVSMIILKFSESSEKLLDLFKTDLDTFKNFLPLINVVIKDVNHIPLFEGAKRIKYFEKIPLEYLNYLSESKEVSIRLESPIDEFPNPNGNILKLRLMGNIIPFQWGNLNSLTSLSVNYSIGDNIRHLTNLTKLHINGFIKRNQVVPKIDLSNNINLIHLIISVNYANISDVIKTIPHPQKLETLNICSAHIVAFEDIGIDSSFSGLLKFSYTNRNNIRSLQGIGNLICLRELYLCNIDQGTDILEIFNLPHIKKIRIKIVSIPQNMHLLHKVSSSLEEIELFSRAGNMDLFDISFLSNLTSIKKIYLSHINAENWEFLLNLKNIKIFKMYKTNFNDLSYLQNKHQIEKLLLFDTNLRIINPLDRFKNLRRLFISSKFKIRILDPYPNKLRSIQVVGDNISFRDKMKTPSENIGIVKIYTPPKKISRSFFL